MDYVGLLLPRFLNCLENWSINEFVIAVFITAGLFNGEHRNESSRKRRLAQFSDKPNNIDLSLARFDYNSCSPKHVSRKRVIECTFNDFGGVLYVTLCSTSLDRHLTA